MDQLLKRQILVILQLLLAFGICGLFYWFGPGWFEAPTDTGTAGRIAYLVPWLLVPAMSVFLCTLITMVFRLFSADTIDGNREPESQFLEINLRVTQNTLEQGFLAILAWLGLAMMLPAGRLTLIPVLAILFAGGRLFFWAGYQISTEARAFGFGMTAMTTAIALFWLCWRLLFN